MTRRELLARLAWLPFMGPALHRLATVAPDQWSRLSQRWHPLKFDTVMWKLRAATYHRYADPSTNGGWVGWFQDKAGNVIAFTRFTQPLRGDPGVTVHHTQRGVKLALEPYRHRMTLPDIPPNRLPTFEYVVTRVAP